MPSSELPYTAKASGAGHERGDILVARLMLFQLSTVLEFLLVDRVCRGIPPQAPQAPPGKKQIAEAALRSSPEVSPCSISPSVSC